MSNPPAEDESGQLFRVMMRSLFSRGRLEVGRLAEGSRKQIDMLALRRDQSRMYEKLGKEVEQLIAIGQVTHPGLQRGFQRLQEINQQIESASEVDVAAAVNLPDRD